MQMPDARIVEMGDCQAETSEEKELGMRLATARTGEQEEMEPLSSDPDCHEVCICACLLACLPLVTLLAVSFQLPIEAGDFGERC